jgi:hypothetical protein
LFYRVFERGITMDEHKGSVILACDDHCAMLVVDKYSYDGKEELYNISMVDSRYYNINGFTGRLKRAWTALCGKPIYYNDILVDDKEKLVKFIFDFAGLFSA